MIKKKISGQTIAIIILAIMLVLSIGFGGVYAFYSSRSNKISGKIMMANLKIALDSGTSEKTEIVISNGVNVVPGQPLENSPLIIRNLSSVNVYLVIVYEVNATKQSDKTTVVDERKVPVLGLGLEYINSIHPEYSSTISVSNNQWVDYVFNAEEESKTYRCLVSIVSFAPTAEDESGITVIPENKLSLSGQMGNEYQGTMLAFTFQAYAIGSESGFGFEESDSNAVKCEEIVTAIYDTQDHRFLNADVTK